MTFFDETQEYWGNTTKPIIGANDNRFSARSVKIFADGDFFSLSTELIKLIEFVQVL